MRYQAAIFDLFGTLIYPFDGVQYEASLRAMAKVLRASHEVFYRAWAEDTWPQRVTGALPTVEANILAICEACGIASTGDEIAEAVRIRYAFTRSVLRPRPDAVSTLAAIKARGLRVGLISDCSSEVPDLWAETLFAPLIDVPIFSARSHTRKPEPQIYRLACEGLEVAPSACLYVADGFSQELAGAAALGMRAVLMAPPHESQSVNHTDWEGATWAGDRITALAQIMYYL